MTQTLFPLFVIVLAGSLAALQAPMNSALGAGLGSGMVAAAVSFGIGFVALVLVVVLSGETAHFSKLGSVNRWLLLGGCLGAFYVWAILWAIPALGVLTAVSAMILGQLIVALVLDANGAFGMQVSKINMQRVLAVVLVASGLVLSKI